MISTYGLKNINNSKSQKFSIEYIHYENLFNNQNKIYIDRRKYPNGISCTIAKHFINTFNGGMKKIVL